MTASAYDFYQYLISEIFVIFSYVSVKYNGRFSSEFRNNAYDDNV